MDKEKELARYFETLPPPTLCCEAPMNIFFRFVVLNFWIYFIYKLSLFNRKTNFKIFSNKKAYSKYFKFKCCPGYDGVCLSVCLLPFVQCKRVWTGDIWLNTIFLKMKNWEGNIFLAMFCWRIFSLHIFWIMLMMKIIMMTTTTTTMITTMRATMTMTGTTTVSMTMTITVTLTIKRNTAY